MYDYNLICEALQEAINNGEIDIDFAESVNDLAYSKYVLESGDADPEVIRKSSKEFLDMLNERKKSNKEGVTEIKAALKNKDYVTANKKVDDLLKETRDLKKRISSMNSTVFEIIGSEVISALSTFAVFKVLSDYVVGGPKNSLKTTAIGAGVAALTLTSDHVAGKRDFKQSDMQRHCIKMLDVAINDLNKLKTKITKAMKKKRFLT